MLVFSEEASLLSLPWWIGQIPGWVQALGVIAALLATRSQSKSASAMHRDAEDKANQRHRDEIRDRHRERLIENYTKLCRGIARYLTRHRMADQLDPIAMKAMSDSEKDPNNERKHEGAKSTRQGVMQYREQAEDAFSEVITAHLALRFDESGDHLKKVDDTVAAAANFRGGDINPILSMAMELIEARSKELRASLCVSS